MTEIGFGSAVKPGLRIGGEYTVVRPLGEGGMGAVYVAVQESTGKERALKIMHREIVADPGLQLLGQTINAAGPDGKGKAVHGFRFVPN